jgi:hypothetical protein
MWRASPKEKNRWVVQIQSRQHQILSRVSLHVNSPTESQPPSVNLFYGLCGRNSSLDNLCRRIVNYNCKSLCSKGKSRLIIGRLTKAETKFYGYHSGTGRTHPQP